MTAKAAIGMLGKALGEWLRESGFSPQDVDQAFADGRQHLLLAGIFGGADPTEVQRFRGIYTNMARAMGPAEYARILDSAAYKVPEITAHCDVIGKLHWADYERTLDDLKERFLSGRPLVDTSPEP